MLAANPDADGVSDAALDAVRGERDAESRDLEGTLGAIGDAEGCRAGVDVRQAAAGSAISSTAIALILLLLRMTVV